jgi:hypothetical protein
MRNIHKREARVAPRSGKWEAFFADAPRERCLGDTPQLALAALRKHAVDCAKVSVAQYERSVQTCRKRNVLVFASVFLGALLATAFIMQATANVNKPPAKMYAHHRMHGHASE